MIRAEKLSKKFGDRLAVDALDLHVERGEVFGLLGPNGAGKTTTVRMLTALVGRSSGRAWVAGHELGVHDDRVRASVGVLTETPGIYARLSVEQNLEFFARLQCVQDVRGKVQKYLSLLGLWERRRDAAGSLSKGMRQKLAIARALVHEPPVIFLDEPTSALDPASSSALRDFLGSLRQEGRTLVVCTHNLDEAERLSDRIGIVKQRLLRVDTPARLRRSSAARRVRVRLVQVRDEDVQRVRALAFVSDVTVEGETLRVTVEDPERDDPELVRALVEGGAGVRFVEEELVSLERAYLELVGEAGEP